MITSRNMTFNESDIPCISEKHQGDVSIDDKEDTPRLQVKLWTPQDPTDLDQPNKETKNVFYSQGDIEENIQEGEGNDNPLKDYQITRDRARREIRELARLSDYLSLVVLCYQNLAFKEPKSYEEAFSYQLSRNWQ